MIHKVSTLLVLSTIVTAIAPATESEFSVEVKVTGAEPGVGQVLVSLFNSSESYLVTPVSEAAEDVDDNGNALASLGEHAAGEYAIAVIYDKNENGKLDTGLFRIPKEEIGFSNNAKARFGPAKWEDARFVLIDSDASIDVQLEKAQR